MSLVWYFFQHTIHVVATDGNDVEAESAQSIIISSGERFDILVKTDGNPRKNYFIRAETIEVKNRRNVRFLLLWIDFILNYTSYIFLDNELFNNLLDKYDSFK